MKFRKLLLLLAAMTLVFAACGDSDEGGSGGEDTGTDDAAAGGTIEITGNEYAFEVDSELEGGFVELNFDNKGKLKHEASFVQVKTDPGEKAFIDEFKAVVAGEGAPIPAYMEFFAAGNQIAAGTSLAVDQSLPAGTYYIVCTLTDADSQENADDSEEAPELPYHFEQGMIKKVTVTGPDTVELPAAGATIVAKDHSFDVQGLKAGKQEVLFRNDGPAEPHMAAILEFPTGVDEAKAGAALQAFSSEGPPPPGTPEPTEAGFAGVFSPKGGGTTELDLKSGQVYAFVCFISDRAGGPPHVAKGMVKLTTIT